MQNQFTIKPIEMRDCDQCNKDAELHRYGAHFGNGKTAPNYCACGLGLSRIQVVKQCCGYCGDQQVYSVLKCPIKIDLDRPFPFDMVNTIKHLLLGNSILSHTEYKGVLRFKPRKND